MRAAVLYEPHSPLVIEEIELDEPAHGDVLIELKASGVCHSDWHVVKGDWPSFDMPIVLGHEGAGVVTAVGPGVSQVEVGDHVITSFKTPCGLCDLCLQGRSNLCEHSPLVGDRMRLRSSGQPVGQFVNVSTFSTHTVVPEIATVPIDRDIPFEQASLVGCGVATGIGAVINTARVSAGSSVAVFGCGGVGLNVIQGAQLAGASTIIAVDINDFKLELATTFGATHQVNASNTDPVAAIQELTGGAGTHYAFEAIGLIAEPMVQSIHCTRRGGTTVWLGAAPADTPVTIDAQDLKQEKVVMGCYYGSSRPRIDFPRILDLYRGGRLKLDELITKRLPFEEINGAFEALSKGEVARSVLVFD